MKILHINFSDTAGGAAKAVLRIHQILLRLGIDTSILVNEKNSNFVYELQFDKLVNNPEEESKKLMKFCELPWSKKCLEFYKRKDLISKTASNIQIRSAIHKHSPEKYLPYKKLLNKYGGKYSWFN